MPTSKMPGLLVGIPSIHFPHFTAKTTAFGVFRTLQQPAQLKQLPGETVAVAYLYCPVQSCFEVFVHQSRVCSLVQQSLGVLGPVVESSPVERSHSLKSTNPESK